MSVGSSPWGIDAADALGPTDLSESLDGYPDIAIAVGQVQLETGDALNWVGLTGKVLVYRNTQAWQSGGNGLEQYQQIFLNQQNAYTLAADVKWGDMTGDGRPDLVISATTHFDEDFPVGAVGVYVYEYRSSSNEFEFRSYQDTPFPVRGLTLADFDDDGDLDVAAAVDLAERSDTESRDFLYVMPNDGTGILLPETGYDVRQAAIFSNTEVVSGTFDTTPGGATLPDLVTTDWDLGAAACFTNDGITFSPTYTAEPCGGGWQFIGAAVGRFTSGKTTDDVVGVDPTSFLYVLHGDGNGGFAHDCVGSVTDVYSTGGGEPLTWLPRGVDVGPLNGGTRTDIAVANGDQVRILLGRGDGSFQYNPAASEYKVAVVPPNTPSPRCFRLVIADLNQDGFGDIVTSNHGSAAFEGSMSVIINGLSVQPSP